MSLNLSQVAMLVWNDFRNDARVLKEAETLQAEGYQVTVHALHTPGVTEKQETLGSGVRVARVAISPLWKRGKDKAPSSEGTAIAVSAKATITPAGKTGLLWQTYRIAVRLWAHLGLIVQMVRSSPDVVHAHDVNTLPTAWLVAVLTRSPLVYDAHEISTGREGYASFRSLVGCIEKFLMPRAAGTITTTDTRAKFFARAYGITRPLVLQNRPCLTATERSQRIREELQLDQLWPIVLYQGGLQPGRGLERLVDVAAQVENAYFVFIGSGPLEAILKGNAHSLKLEDRVRFIPTVPLQQLLHYTASADIGVQPIENTCLNHFSTDSNKLFEYVHAGLPVIASDLPEIRRVVNEHELGILVPTGNSKALAAAIKELVRAPVKRARFSDNAKRAADTLSWESQEHELTMLYRQVLNGRNHAPVN